MLRWVGDAEEELEVAGNLTSALMRIKTSAGMNSLTLMPNFRFNYLPPPTGWVASFPAGAPFTQYPFQTDKFRTITVVRMKIDPEDITSDKLIKMQRQLQIQFPLTPAVEPDLSSTMESGFSPGLGTHGCSIGIYDSRDKASRRVFFLVCHSSLPAKFVDSLQERDRQLHLSPTPLNQEVEECEKMELVARELAIRNMHLFCSITGLQVDGQIATLDKETYSAIQTLPLENNRLFQDALKEWSGGIIYPFSRINPTPAVKQELWNYEIGKVASMKTDPSLRFENTIYTFQPDAQVCYNTFRSVAGHVYYYNNCVPMEGALVMDLGLERGVRLINYDWEKRQAHMPVVRNDFGNGLPVTFPYNHQPPRVVDRHTSSLFFSIDGSGGPASGNTTARQLEGQYYNNNLPPQVMGKLLPFPLVDEMQLNPLFVLLSPEGPRGAVI